MNNVTRLGSLVISVAFAGAVLAQAPAPAAPAPGHDHPAHAAFSSVDQNKDGRVSQIEAQSHNELKSAFATLDTDKDTYLSSAEFAKWNAGKPMGAAPKGDKGASNYSTPKAEPALPATP